MIHSISRRGFMQATGAAGGIMVATGFSPLSYAQNETVAVAAIGTGGQGSFHLRDGLARAHNIRVVAVCDRDRPHLEGGWQNAGGGDVRKYTDYRAML
ncbi:MAG TPA: twin-arginine translocation signal domain-containing protein, partial [Candidatus Hydrogenedentes bacterium]|nr:twin-arginine translocation signal domain-containing protein [Candidatus Hydrogenedentota bacterium]